MMTTVYLTAQAKVKEIMRGPVEIKPCHYPVCYSLAIPANLRHNKCLS
jgi:hypothetical protein